MQIANFIDTYIVYITKKQLKAYCTMCFYAQNVVRNYGIIYKTLFITTGIGYYKTIYIN